MNATNPMTGIDKIIAHIEAEAQAEIERIQAQTAERTAKIQAEAAAEAEAAAARILHQGKQAAEQREQRLVSAEEMESKKQLLATRQQLVTEAFERALNQLRHLQADEYVALLATLAANAAITGEEELIFSAKDKESYAQAVCDKANQLLAERHQNNQLHVAAEERPLDGGFYMRRGQVELNFDFASLIHYLRGTISSEVAQVLFD